MTEMIDNTLDQPDLTVQPETDDLQNISLTDLDLALAHWARRQGADILIARAFALASWAVGQGHACLDLQQIPTQLMSADNQAQLPRVLQDSDLVGQPGQTRPLILDNDRLYLQRYHDYESCLARRLNKLMASPPRPVDIDKLLPDHGLFAGEAGHTNWQAVAAFMALRHQLSVISGGPGTGKTYTIVRLLRLLVEDALENHQHPPLIALAAPTGKAAARMLESVQQGLLTMRTEANLDHDTLAAYIPAKAQTLHRLLGLTGQTTRPRFDGNNPLPHDVIIIDEASMVDLPLMAKLADATGPNARLILLGDRYQLASVESGAVLADICSHAGINQFTSDQQQAAGSLLAHDIGPGTHQLADHVVTLQTSRRFNADSPIGRLAAAVNDSHVEEAQSLLAAGHESLRWQPDASPATIDKLTDRLAADYAALCRAQTPQEALGLLGRQCVLTAVRQGPNGSQAINDGVTEKLAQQFEFNVNERWYHGRPIMVTQNDYQAGLYNGDIGLVMTNEQGQTRVWFQGNDGIKALLPSTLPEHGTVYAMTVHKSQGSEFHQVVMVLPEHDSPILSQELLYTGLTRARQTLTIYARADILTTTMQTRVKRVSGLADRLTGSSQS